MTMPGRDAGRRHPERRVALPLLPRGMPHHFIANDVPERRLARRRAPKTTREAAQDARPR